MRDVVRTSGALVLGLLGLASTAAAQEPRPDAISALLARAEAASARGRDAQAWALWARAARRAPPEDGRVALALGAALPTEPVEASPAVRERAVRARDALDDFLEHAAPEHPAARRAAHLRGWAAALAGDHGSAIERVGGAIGLQDRESATWLGRLAALAVRRGDLEAARRALVAAHRAWPQDDEGLRDLGAIELALGRPGEAVERYARIVGRRPEDLAARRDLAGALVAAGRAEEAMAILARAAELHPEDADLWIECAHAALEAGAPDRAERAARAAIERLASDDGRGHAALGAALAALGRREAAAAAFDEALRRDPSDVRARQGRDTLRAAPAEAATAGRGLAAP